MTRYDIIGLGVSTLDFLTVVEEFPSRESVQKAHFSLLQGGGPVATAMVTAARLGAKVAMIDSLGDDWISELILKEFKEAGVETRHIVITDGATASMASINVRERDGQRAIVYSPGSAQELIDIPSNIIQRAKIVHMNGRHLKACKKVCERKEKSGTLISFDGGAGRYRDEIGELANSSDISRMNG